jgi:hypothetical protein
MGRTTTSTPAQKRTSAPQPKSGLAELPLGVVGSTDRCNTLGEGLCWRSIEQGLSGSFVELSGDGAELGLAEAASCPEY